MEENKKTVLNTNKGAWTIVGVLCALANINLIGLIVSIIGLKNSKNDKTEYKYFGIGGILISTIHIIRLLFLLVFTSIWPIISGTTDLVSQTYNIVSLIINLL